MGVGRPKKPTILKLTKGTAKKSRLLKDEAVTIPISNLPQPPEHLSDESKKEWTYMIEQLDLMGCLGSTDLAAFEQYCFYVGEWRNMLPQVSKLTPNNQNLSILYHHKSLSDKAMKIATEFGFTPASRTKVSATKKKANDPIADILGKANNG